MPFPFTDLTADRKPHALVVSPGAHNRLGPDLVIAFITSRTDVPPRSGDHRIRFWKESGLLKASLLRMKFATIDSDIVSIRIGRFHPPEQCIVCGALSEFFGDS